MRSGPRSRFGFARTLAETVVGTLMSLRTRGTHARPQGGWKAGATEFHLPDGLRRRLPHGAIVRQPRAQASRAMRPLLVFGFLLAFASIGVGFGGLDVDPDSAHAPGTPALIVIVRAPQFSNGGTATEPAESARSVVAADDGGHVSAANNRASDNEAATTVASATVSATNTVEPSPTAELDAVATDPTPATVPPTATAVPAAATPAPAWDYHPVTHLSEAEVRAAASSAGWPAGLLDQVVEVAWCESSYRPNATNGWAYGVMQLVPNWFDYAGVDFALWTDPVVNLRVAYAAYQYDIGRGNTPWQQWICQPSGGAVDIAPAAPTPTVTAPPPSILGGQ